MPQKTGTDKERFDKLLQMMASQPEPPERPAAKVRTSEQAAGAGYGDARTRAGKSASASSKPKSKSR